MIMLDENLYCFSSVSEDDSIHFKHLSIEDLSVLEDYDITEYGNPADMLKIGDNIYFTNQYTDETSSKLSNKITVFNNKEKTFSQIELTEDCPNDIMNYNNLLIISHHDRVQSTGGKITLYNLSTKKIERVIDLGQDAVQCILNNDALYVLSHDSITEYLLKENNLEKLNTSKTDMQNGSTYFYLSSVFTC